MDAEAALPALPAPLPEARAPLRLPWVLLACLTLGLLLVAAARLTPAAPAPALALLLPFTSCQLPLLAASLALWAQHPPCLDPPKARVALFFYYNGDLAAGEGPAALAEASRLWASLAPLHRCFPGGVTVLGANLSAAQDKYPVGTCLQFTRAFPLLRGSGFEHFLLLEPDTVPIRADWAAPLVRLAAGNAGCRAFWQAGSVPVFKDALSDTRHLTRPEHYIADTHLNGNSLYCLADGGLEEFVARSQLATRHGFCGEMAYGYDFAMWRFAHLPASRPYMNFRFHRFRVADFIANFDAAPYDAEALRLAHPALMLVHGKSSNGTDAKALNVAARDCRADARAQGLLQPLAALGPGGVALLCDHTFSLFDYSFMLFRDASLAEGGGAWLTGEAAGQSGALELDALYRPVALCAGAPACRLRAELALRVQRNSSTTPDSLADGVAIAFLDGDAQLPGTTRYISVHGVEVPRNALVLVLDEFDNAGDGTGYRVLDTRPGKPRELARRADLAPAYLAGESVALEVTIALGYGGGVLTLALDGQPLLEEVPLGGFPPTLYLSASANTGDRLAAHHLGRLRLCVLTGAARSCRD